MDDWLGRLLAVAYPTLIVCGSALLAYWMKLRHERDIARERQDDIERLRSLLAALREEQLARLAELEERVHQSERLLLQRRPAPQNERLPAPV